MQSAGHTAPFPRVSVWEMAIPSCVWNWSIGCEVSSRLGRDAPPDPWLAQCAGPRESGCETPPPRALQATWTWRIVPEKGLVCNATVPHGFCEPCQHQVGLFGAC